MFVKMFEQIQTQRKKQHCAALLVLAREHLCKYKLCDLAVIIT